MTVKQTALIDAFLARLSPIDAPVYGGFIEHMSGLGYKPVKYRASLSFKHDKHNKQIAKIGINESRKKGAVPFLALRFSACKGYSQRFIDIVDAYMDKYTTREARCVDGSCAYCAGPADTHVYTNGASGRYHCGAYAVEIPGVSADDLPEIKKIVNEEHEYLMKYEAGRT